MRNAEFLDKAFRTAGPKIINGFSRPVFHNMAGLLLGHQINKRAYGDMLRYSESAMLYIWARRLAKNSTIVEIGCYAGLSTLYLAKGSRFNHCYIFTIDPFDSDFKKQEERSDHFLNLENKPFRESVLHSLRSQGLEGRVELIEGYAEEVVKEWERPVDFLWIDGNHNQTYQDYLDWSPFLRPGARVAVHDAHPRYGLPNVAEAARRIFSSDKWERLEHVKGIVSGVLKD